MITQNGSQGVYMFASQRLRRGPEGDGVSGFIRFGANDLRTTLFATRYFGLGLTGFGLIPGRPGDSFGAGLAWSGLNQNVGYRRRDEVLFQVYDQIEVRRAFYLEPALTLSTPGETSARQPPLAFTLQSTILSEQLPRRRGTAPGASRRGPGRRSRRVALQPPVLSTDCGRREPGVVRADFLVERRGFEMMAIGAFGASKHGRDVVTVLERLEAKPANG